MVNYTAILILRLVLREEVPPTVSKPVLGWISKDQLGKLSNDNALEIGLHMIDRIAAQRHMIAFEEEDANVKRQVAEIHAAKKDFDVAAKTLERINLEGAHR